MLRIAITDDHTLFRKSLALLIRDFEDMEVVLEAGNGVELLEKLKTTPVDILLLDLQMPVMDGFETFENVRQQYPHIKTAILTLRKDADAIRDVIKMKVHGYFTKNTPPKELEDAIWNLKDNGFHSEQGLASIIKEVQANLDIDFDSMEIHFTDRELDIIKLTAQGVKPKDIADMLNISPKTVNAHKQNIQQKYNFPDMIPAILYCTKIGIIDLDEIV